MSEERDIVEELTKYRNHGLSYRLARTKQFLADQRERNPDLLLLFSDGWADVGDANDLIQVLEPLAFEAAHEIKRLREENRQLRERSTEAVIAWINETIKRAGEANILKRAQDGV